MAKLTHQCTEAAGREMYALAVRLFPLHRSITGEGVRETLRILAERLPLTVHEVPTGTQAFDWKVPQEWKIRDAFIADSNGNRVVDYQRSTLSVVSYSTPVRRTMRWSELRPHLFSLPEHPHWTPYRTSYFDESWGFCLPHAELLKLEALGDVEYEVCIDSSLEDGSLTYGEVFLPGESAEEVLFWAHTCHPSLANDNLSGIAVATQLAETLQQIPKRRYSYRFVFGPATIGAITWLSRNEDVAKRVRHGLVLTLLGDRGGFTYKRSRRGDAEIDRVVAHALQLMEDNHELRDFSPIGYDERQFCSPGFDLPMGCLMRTPNGEYPEYHTSADNLELITPDALAQSWELGKRIVDILEHNRTFVNQNPKCEPRLGPRGLYRAFGQSGDAAVLQEAVQWVLNLADGCHSLLDIAERAHLEFTVVTEAAAALQNCGLLALDGQLVV